MARASFMFVFYDHYLKADTISPGRIITAISEPLSCAVVFIVCYKGIIFRETEKPYRILTKNFSDTTLTTPERAGH